VAAVVVLTIAILLLAPLAVERFEDELVERIAGAIGEEVRLEALDLRLLAPRLHVAGLEIGSPRLFTVGDADVRVDAGQSLLSGRLRLRVTMRDVAIDLSRDSGDDAPTEEEEGAGGGPPVPVDLAAVVDGLLVVLPDGRELAAGRLAGQVVLAAGGGVDGEAEAEDLELRWRDRVTLLESLEVAATWQDDVLAVQRLQARGPDTRIEAAPAAAATGTERGIAPTAVRLEALLRPVIEFAAAAEVDVSGRAAIDLEVRGLFADPTLQASARVEEPAAEGFRFETLTAEIGRRSGTWRAEDVALTRPDAELIGALRLDESSLRLTGDVGWRAVALGPLLDVAAARGLRTSGDAKLEIELDDLRIEVDGEGRIEGAGGRPIPIAARVTSDGDGFAGTATVAVDDLNRVQIRIDRADAESLAGEAVARVASIETVLEALAYQGPLPARGGLVAEATLAGNLDAPHATLSVSSSELRLADGTPAELSARARISSQRALIETLVLRAGGGELTAAGTIAFGGEAENDWRLLFADLRLAPILESLQRSFGWPLSGIAGTANGRVQVGGPWSSPQATADLSISEAEARGIALGVVAIDATAAQGRWEVEAVAGVAAARHAAVTVRGNGNAVREVVAVVRDWPLRELAADSFELGGSLDAEVRIEAADGDSDGTVTLSVDGVEIGEQRLGDSRIEASGRGGAWDIGGRLLDGAVELDAELAAKGNLPFQARLRWRPIEVPALVVGEDRVDVASQGLLTIHGELTEPRGIDASLEVEELSIVSGDRRLSSDGPLRAQLAGGALRLAPIRLAGGTTQLSLRGEAAAAGEGTLVVEGAVGLDWLAYLVPAIEESAGKADLQIDVVFGDGGLQRLDGEATVRDAAIEVRGVPPATGLRGDFSFSATQVSIAALSAEVGGGRFRAAGTIGLQTGPELEWSFNEVGVEPVRHLEMILTGRGSLSGGWREPPLLAGDVTVENLLYDRNLEYQDLIPSFDRAMAPALRIEREQPPLRFDLRIRARDGLYVENNIAGLEARADLRLRGTPNEPSLRGAVEIIDGAISIRGRSFDIENGVLSFRPDLPGEAFIDFAAESIIEAEGIPYRITVRVTGTTDDYRVHLESEEGLSQTDIASLIAFGKTVAQLQQGGESDPAIDRLSGLAGGQVGGFLAGEARDVLPFDEIEIRPGYSPSTGQFEPQLRVGKTITADLSAWVGQTFGVQPQTLVEVSYALTEQISTLLRWESQTQSQEGAFGGEVSQRFDFWGLPNWLRWGDAENAGEDE
jgi:autotransporter translocation and assembly factor TamB